MMFLIVFAAILMDVIYGTKIEDANNKHVVEAEAWDEGFNQAVAPGRFWVDSLPMCKPGMLCSSHYASVKQLIVKYVPEWFPGAGFQRLAAGWRRSMYNARDGPFDEAKNSYVSDIFLFLPYHSNRSL